MSIVIYPLLVMAATVLLLPGGILSLGGGFFFGLWWGTLLVLVGNLLGAAVAFFVGNKLGRKFVRQRILRDPRWAALDGAIGKHGPRIIFYSQLNPLFPTSLFNYLYGITKVRFWECLQWVALGRLPGVFLYCYLGTLGQLGIRILRGESEPGPMEYALWGGGLLLTVGVAALLGHTATKVIEDYRRLAPAQEEKEDDDTLGPPISSKTALRYLKTLGFSKQTAKKGAFYDGYNREDVVVDRMSYLREKL
jgi:uncharacterized membrane protein YdjX (TVP38/TMEM64 family)